MDGTLLLQLTLNGLIVGALYGVVAMSFVLIYKASQVVNFAQGRVPAGRRLGVLVVPDRVAVAVLGRLPVHPDLS